MVVQTDRERCMEASAGVQDGLGAKLRLLGGLRDPAWHAASPSCVEAPGSAETLPG